MDKKLEKKLRDALRSIPPDYRSDTKNFSHIALVAKSLKKTRPQDDLAELNNFHKLLNECVTQIVDLNYKGFNKSIRNFSDILVQVQESLHHIEQLEKDLQSSEELLVSRSDDLMHLYSAYLQHSEFLKILKDMEQVKKMDSILEEYIKKKDYNSCILFLQKYETIFEETLREIPALYSIQDRFLYWKQYIPQLCYQEVIYYLFSYQQQQQSEALLHVTMALHTLLHSNQFHNFVQQFKNNCGKELKQLLDNHTHTVHEMIQVCNNLLQRFDKFIECIEESYIEMVEQVMYQSMQEECKVKIAQWFCIGSTPLQQLQSQQQLQEITTTTGFKFEWNQLEEFQSNTTTSNTTTMNTTNTTTTLSYSQFLSIYEPLQQFCHDKFPHLSLFLQDALQHTMIPKIKLEYTTKLTNSLTRILHMDHVMLLDKWCSELFEYSKQVPLFVEMIQHILKLYLQECKQLFRDVIQHSVYIQHCIQESAILQSDPKWKQILSQQMQNNTFHVLQSWTWNEKEEVCQVIKQVLDDSLTERHSHYLIQDYKSIHCICSLHLILEYLTMNSVTLQQSALMNEYQKCLHLSHKCMFVCKANMHYFCYYYLQFQTNGMCSEEESMEPEGFVTHFNQEMNRMIQYLQQNQLSNLKIEYLMDGIPWLVSHLIIRHVSLQVKKWNHFGICKMKRNIYSLQQNMVSLFGNQYNQNYFEKSIQYLNLLYMSEKELFQFISEHVTLFTVEEYKAILLSQVEGYSKMVNVSNLMELFAQLGQ